MNDLEKSIKAPPKYGWYIDSCCYLMIGYQILGILILQTGSLLPDRVKEMILKSTTWKFDKSRGWDQNSIKSRKYYLKDFRKKIIDYLPGQKITSFIESIN